MSYSELIEQLNVLKSDINELAGCIQDLSIPHSIAAEALRNAIQPKIDLVVTRFQSNQQSANDQISHDLLMEVFEVIQNDTHLINDKTKNLLNILSQHDKTRAVLLKIIDDLLELPELANENHDYLLQHHNDYEELAKQIKQVIRSTPKLKSAISK